MVTTATTTIDRNTQAVIEIDLHSFRRRITSATRQMEIITQDAYEQRWQAGIVSKVEIANAHGFDRMAIYKHQWSTEHNCQVELPGLYLELCDEQFRHDLNAQGIHDDFQVLAFRLYL